MDCPFCCEEIADSAIKCKHCGEFLDESEEGESSSGMPGALIAALAVLAVFGLVCVVGIGAAIIIPNLAGPSRKNANEAAAIGALKTIGTAQSLFREADKEADGNLDYGTLQELGAAGTTGLIDALLASGTKNGYIFECTYSSPTSEFLWMATARPALPGVTGVRYFATNHEGVIWYQSTGPIALDNIDCTIPAQLMPVGR